MGYGDHFVSKKIESPVKRWPGSVTLKCPVPLEPYDAWQRSINALTAVRADVTNGEVASDPALLRLALPGVCALVETWDLGGDFPKGVTPDTFPFIPRVPSIKLIAWLISEINAIIGEEDDLPLA